MARTTVELETDTRDQLADRKQGGESYDDVVRRLLKESRQLPEPDIVDELREDLAARDARLDRLEDGLNRALDRVDELEDVVDQEPSDGGIREVRKGVLDDEERGRDQEPGGADRDVDVDDVLEGWLPGRNDEERRERRAAGRTALAWALEQRAPVTAKRAKDELLPEHGLDDQSADTWWRKVARPALQRAVDAELLEYRDGHHDYVSPDYGE